MLGWARPGRARLGRTGPGRRRGQPSVEAGPGQAMPGQAEQFVFARYAGQKVQKVQEGLLVLLEVHGKEKSPGQGRAGRAGARPGPVRTALDEGWAGPGLARPSHFLFPGYGKRHFMAQHHILYINMIPDMVQYVVPCIKPDMIPYCYIHGSIYASI